MADTAEVAVSVFDVVEAVGYFACLSEVVLDGKDGDALVLMEGIEFLVDVALAGQVDAGRWFIEDEEIRASHERPCDQHFLMLAAREASHELFLVPFHACHGKDLIHVDFLQMQQFPVGMDDFFHGDGKGGIRGEPLRYVADAAGAARDRPGDRFQEAQYDFQKSALAASIISYDGNILSARQMEIDVFQEPGSAPRVGKI